MTSYRIITNSRPYDYRSGIQRMSKHDERVNELLRKQREEKRSNAQ